MSVAASPSSVGALETLDAVGALYDAQAHRVRRLVHLQVPAPEATIEDACQVAWCRLVMHRARVTRDGAVRWLVRVAVHEVHRALGRAGRDVSLEVVEGLTRAPRVGAPPLVEELTEARARLGAIEELPERQRQLVWLQAVGFSYTEISRRTGESPRTVERQLLRAKRALVRADAIADADADADDQADAA